MKKHSIFPTFLLVVCMMTSSVFAQIGCTDDLECDDGVACNGAERCDLVDDCQPGDSQCEEGQVCDIEKDECVFVGSVDIKPGSCQSPLNVRSRGVLPVAILGTEGFEVETINPDTLMIHREGFDSLKPIRYSYEDVGAPSEGDPCVCEDLDGNEIDEDSGGDGIMDLTLKFSVPELVDGLGLQDVESREIIPLTILWESEDGTPLRGEDCVKIINPMKWWDDLVKKIKKPKKPKNGDEE